MKRVTRHALPSDLGHRLWSQQLRLLDEVWGRDASERQGAKAWENRAEAEKKALKEILKAMVGTRARCYYCLDSRGTDIEHFWPKARFPGGTFCWSNLLLACKRCNTDLKDEWFDLMPDGTPALIDPTVEDPWSFFDFDPGTGALVPRCDLTSADAAKRAEKTIDLLQLGTRPELTEARKHCFERLAEDVEAIVSGGFPHRELDVLQRNDAFDLLGWATRGLGFREPAFAALRQHAPSVWQQL